MSVFPTANEGSVDTVRHLFSVFSNVAFSYVLSNQLFSHFVKPLRAKSCFALPAIYLLRRNAVLPPIAAVVAVIQN